TSTMEAEDPTPIQIDLSAPVPQVTGCRTHGQVALTYSEGPSDATAGIARQLNQAEARGNFFINASMMYAQQYAMVVQNLYHAGHLIGMTYRVPFDLEERGTESVTDDMLVNDILNQAYMIETLIGMAPKYVRMHYTATSPSPLDVRAEHLLHQNGFVLVGYNLDSKDYQLKDGGSIEKEYVRAFRHQKDTYDAKGSFISIQYDVPSTGSLKAVPNVIKALNDEGYTAVRLDGCLNDPAPYKASAQQLSYVGDKFSFNTTGYHQGQKLIPIVAEASENEDAVHGLSAQPDESSANRHAMTLPLLSLTLALLLYDTMLVFL
ncbi:uncharacterized protein BYT42DRAFT_637481, partial [Radiomyces spectabilis]|uniref:uncharacterized protein n=1 Tax=Radiomyces spectabilis TaxID=64574 RepID=UPI00221F0F19